MVKKETILSVLQEIRDILKNRQPQITAAPRLINDRFIDNGDGTVSDKEQKVTWVKDPTALKGFEKIMTWEEAKTACENLSFAGFNSGWRMPTVQELRSIIDYTRHDPAWNTDIFGGKHNDWYWTSTECAWDKSSAWCVSSFSGGVSSFYKSNRNYVRPVRSSQ